MFFQNGKRFYNDLYELYYDLFIELGIGIDANTNYMYDQDTCTPIMFKDKNIKATTNPNIPIYAGRNDIVFDPPRNYGLISTLFGYYLNKCQYTDDGDILGGYIAHYIEDNDEKDKQRVCVKTFNRGIICSDYHYNIYLSYIDCIFKIAGYNDIDLSNFDILVEQPKK